ncbi:MAG TPA: class I SAM-dependent methyltransferase [Candidatus Udaeobacter sp.]|nr:class I SAM-dependent methyltransferase [Candidatus Udaeobacter sp.]
MASHSDSDRANFCSYRWDSVLILLLAVGCARLKQCAYEGFSRDEWQQPKRVIESLQIRPGDHVADLGAGSGYFTFDLAKAVGPGGKIYAVDIDRDMTDLLAKRAKEEGANNVDVILAKPEDPLLPAASVDLILSVDAYHHIPNRVNYFSNLRKYLRPDGRVGIVEFDRRAWFGGLWGHYTPSEFIKREMEQAGYVLQREFDFLDRQSFLIFVPKKSDAKNPRQASPLTQLLKRVPD